MNREEFRKRGIKNLRAKKEIDFFFRSRCYPDINWSEEGVKAFLYGLLDRLTAEGDLESIEMKKVLKDVIDPWEFYIDKEILVSELRNGVADESLVELYNMGKRSIKIFQCEICGEAFATKPNWYYDKSGSRRVVCDTCFEYKLRRCAVCGKIACEDCS